MASSETTRGVPGQGSARRIRSLAMGLAVLVGLAGCFPSPPKDDEGHASFAVTAIPVLLGRRAHGVDEVEVVADIAQLLGRDVAVRMLMKDQAYVDHWASAFADLLEMQRESSAGLPAQDDACWGAPTRSAPDPAIAEWVRDHGPAAAGAPTPPWTFTDLLQSALVIDDVSVVYRAYLFALSMRQAVEGNVKRRREALTDRLLRVYLNRDVTCLRCHNPTLSASNKVDNGGNVVWRRLWSIPGHPEKALFGNYYDADSTLSRVRLIMRGDVRKPDGGGFGIRPWGMAEDCALDTDSTAPSNAGTLLHEGFQALGAGTTDYPNAGFGSLDGAINPKVSLWELEASLRQGILDLQDGYERFEAATPLLPPDQQQYCSVVQEFSANCVGCHSGAAPPGGLDLSSDPAGALVNVNTQHPSSTETLRVEPGDPADSELSLRLNSGAYPPRMPPAASLPAMTATVDAWITAGAPSTDTANCNSSPVPDVHPNEAFAFLTATNAVDGIWTAAMGYPLTIDHGFPRNADQRDMLWNLTEYTFLPQGWALKGVLTKVLASNWFARRAPTISQFKNAYALQAVLDPWKIADPTEVTNPPPHQRFNGQGELVNRFRVNTLLRTVAGTLGWKAPRLYAGGGYPSPLDQDLGQYLSPETPGFQGINFQSLLALEAEIGLCSKTGHAEAADDWIDALVAAIGAHNTANPDAPITLGEAWSLLKDRMIQDPTIERELPSALASVPNAKTEEQALIALLNQGLNIVGGLDLDTPTSELSDIQLANKLREGCGVLVKTPEFMLTNVTPRGYSDNDMPDPPRLAVCLDGEPCGYAQACNHWRGRLFSMGHIIACEDRSVRKAQLITLLPAFELATELVPFKPGPFTPVLPSGNLRVRPLAPPEPIPPRPPISGRTVLTTDASEIARSDSILRAQTSTLDAASKIDTAAQTERLTRLDAVRQRSAALCPRGICGFVERPDTASCIQRPTPGTCGPLLPPCDPRSADGADFCGRPPADIHDTGVFVMWAEGATVKETEAVRILRAESGKWQSLRAGWTLEAGDLLHVPLDATLTLELDGRKFGSRGLDTERVEGVPDQLFAITGPSAGRFLATPTKEGALSPARLRAGLEKGLYDSQGVFTKPDWGRLIGYGARPHSKPTPTLEDIREINADFESLHFPPESGLAPDGTDLLPEDCECR